MEIGILSSFNAFSGEILYEGKSNGLLVYAAVKGKYLPGANHVA